MAVWKPADSQPLEILSWTSLETLKKIPIPRELSFSDDLSGTFPNPHSQGLSLPDLTQSMLSERPFFLRPQSKELTTV